MVNKNYRNGADKERRVVNRARAEGSLAFRSAGSHSEIDVFILNPKTKLISLIQCKPKSMSDKKKKEIEQHIKRFEGYYRVICEVL